jgi:hypothetical protein
MAKKKSVGRPKKPLKFSDLVDSIYPIDQMFNESEMKLFNGIIEMLLRDFDEDQLSVNDMDDLVALTVNRVLETRLLKESKGDVAKAIDAASTIDKFRKQNDKIKQGLAARRTDRIDPKKFSGFSIIDLVAMWDANKKKKLEDKMAAFFEEEKKLLESDLLTGNKNDADASSVDKEEK